MFWRWCCHRRSWEDSSRRLFQRLNISASGRIRCLRAECQRQTQTTNKHLIQSNWTSINDQWPAWASSPHLIFISSPSSFLLLLPPPPSSSSHRSTDHRRTLHLIFTDWERLRISGDSWSIPENPGVSNQLREVSKGIASE